MAGESEDTVSKSRSTEDILAETEQLLSETGAGTQSGDESADRQGTTDASTDAEFEALGDRQPDADSSRDATASGRSWLSRFRPSVPSVGLSSYFSVREFIGLVAALGVGYVGGGLTIPIAGSLVGLFAVAFVLGVLTSKRRYAEVAAAGGVVGAVTALFNHFVIVIGGLSNRLVLIGLTAGVLACLLGYYFGRDLRAGLTSEV